MAIDRVKIKAGADKLVMAGKVPEAIREYQKLVEDNPRDIATLSQLGNLHLRVGNKAAAVPVFIKVAELFNKTGFATKAVASLKIAVREDDTNLRAWELLAELSEQQGFAKEARLSYEKVAGLIATSGDADAALRVYTKLTELEPDNLKVRLHLGDLLLKKGNRPEALKHYIKAGQALTSQGKIKEAARVYERALQLDPDNIGILEGVVKSHVAQKQPDQAIALLDNLLERTPNSIPLQTLKLDVLVEMGQYEKAKPEILSLHRANPQNLGLLVRAVRVLLHGKDPDGAASLLDPLGVKDQDNAQALYEEILKSFPSHIPSLMGLLASYKAAGNRFQTLTILSRLAEAALTAGDFTRARSAMQELAGLEPQNQQHIDKLRFIEAKAGLGAPPRRTVSPPTPPPAPPPVIAAPEQPEFSIEDTGESEIEVEVVDFETEVEVATPPASEARLEIPSLEAVESPPEEEFSLEEEISIDLEMPNAESEEAQGETDVTPAGPLSPMDAEMIREQFAEAEVFLKYGLGEKAVGALQSVLKKVPDHIQGHQKLIAILKSQGKKDKAVHQTLLLARVFKAQGDMETCETLLDDARAIDPNHKAIQQFFEVAPTKRSSKDSSKLSADDLLKGAIGSKKRAKIEVVATPPPELEIVPEESPSVPVPLEAQPEIVLEGEGSAPPPFEEELLSLEPSPEDVKASQALAEQIEEIEFYLSQDLFREARRAAIAFLKSHPSHSGAVALLARADGALASKDKAEAPAPSDELIFEPEPEVTPAPVEEILLEVPSADSSLDLQPVELVEEVAEPKLSAVEEVPRVAPKARTKMKVTAQDLLGADFLDEESPESSSDDMQEDFSDLANELGAALDGLEGRGEDLFDEETRSAEELSFEEVFQEFRKGVDKKVGQDDFSTHYNLGIAYKEMELVDEAIGEFQIAARSPEYFVECCSMLGICFRQKGLNDLAEKWYRKGIEAPGFSDEIYAGLKYDLAEALEDEGRKEEALSLFKEVYAANANHRDVKAKVFGN